MSFSKENILGLDLDHLHDLINQDQFNHENIDIPFTPSKEETSSITLSGTNSVDVSIQKTGTDTGTGTGSRKRKPKKVNKAIVEGMLYLLKKDAISSSQAKDECYRKILEDKIKSKSPQKLTNDIVFENLMDKTRRKTVNYKQLADVREKKRKKKISSGQKGNKVIVNEIISKERIVVLDKNKDDTMIPENKNELTPQIREKKINEIVK